mmetsp:Transcript_5043/g.18838  ORF Transcript_5043/g.18838 Transcript_5043/m.18838 type:complete len:214 (+) Transcript_5043:419-1060(+)
MSTRRHLHSPTLCRPLAHRAARSRAAATKMRADAAPGPAARPIQAPSTVCSSLLRHRPQQHHQRCCGPLASKTLRLPISISGDQVAAPHTRRLAVCQVRQLPTCSGSDAMLSRANRRPKFQMKLCRHVAGHCHRPQKQPLRLPLCWHSGVRRSVVLPRRCSACCCPRLATRRNSARVLAKPPRPKMPKPRAPRAALGTIVCRLQNDSRKRVVA